MLLDDSKLYNATKKVAQSQLSVRNERVQAGVSAIYMDSRIDKRTVSSLIEGKNFGEKDRVDHYCLVQEPNAEFVGIFSPKSSDEMAKAEVVAECFIMKLVSLGVDVSKLTTLGGDSTNLNTGCNNGAFTKIEKKLGKRLNWIICLLHVLGTVHIFHYTI